MQVPQKYESHFVLVLADSRVTPSRGASPCMDGCSFCLSIRSVRDFQRWQARIAPTVRGAPVQIPLLLDVQGEFGYTVFAGAIRRFASEQLAIDHFEH